MIAMQAHYTIAVIGAGYIGLVCLYVALREALERRSRWLHRHVCPHCGAPIIIRDYPNGTKARVCINGVCGAKWRVRTRGER